MPSLGSLKRILLSVCLVCILLLFVAYVQRDVQSHLFLFRQPVIPVDPLVQNTTPFYFQFCPDILTNSVGPIKVFRDPLSWEQLRIKYVDTTLENRSLSLSSVRSSAGENSSLKSNSLGLWSPIECRPRQTLAMIIPFRQRDEQLRVFLNHMHAFLRHQQLLYMIFVVEQLGTTHFNRAALLNIGFLESRRVANFDCFIFHDVDLLPQDDRILYRCGDQPVHLSAALDLFQYKLLYATLFGGAVAMNRTQFERIRGFSNAYFGWGGEDDDLYQRVVHHGYKVFRYPNDIARYTMLRHNHEDLNQPNPIRHKLLRQSIKRFTHDGYPETEYTVVSAGPIHGGLYYQISVELMEKNILAKLNITSQ
ncbi:hypothetical protein EG68_07044 [Paragonimus skrjabini miyazakii]|uniref:Beta-1,4-galactosyltransferase n=1 Tax=Paragonimus skrjabini miyazakii TaxID=59628 RepID=A0A8S9YA74_9TREM|nr:hypothetical protein EG68_07044 [Paragonimus skrjabini miyazakii]